MANVESAIGSTCMLILFVLRGVVVFLFVNFVTRSPIFPLNYFRKHSRKRCETIFNDSVRQGKGVLREGAIVQPRRGRVVLFSGGMENMHCRMPVIGRREVLQLWFACESDVDQGGDSWRVWRAAQTKKAGIVVETRRTGGEL